MEAGEKSFILHMKVLDINFSALSTVIFKSFTMIIFNK